MPSNWNIFIADISAVQVGGKVEEAAQEVERKGQNLKKKAQS